MKKILVALDNSYRTPALLRAATAAALESHAQLVLVRAVSLSSEIPVEALAIPPVEVALLLEERARHELEVLARGVPAECGTAVVIVNDIPWRAICLTAIKENADVIFIGTHELESRGRLLGTTASMVANHADRPVLIFRDPPMEQKRPELQKEKVGYELF